MNVKSKISYHVKERDGKDLKYTLNSNKIRKFYSWSEKTSLENGIVETIKWIKKTLITLKKIFKIYTQKMNILILGWWRICWDTTDNKTT